MKSEVLPCPFPAPGSDRVPGARQLGFNGLGFDFRPWERGTRLPLALAFYDERAFGAKEQAVLPRRLGELDEGALREDLADVRVAVLVLGDLDAGLHPAINPCVIQSWFRAGNRPSGPDFARTPPGKALQSAI